MPCQVSDDEARAMELSHNRVTYGVATTDAALATTVACQALRFIDEHMHSGLRAKLPVLAQKWWAEHKKRDEERKRDEQAAKRQQEADERATLRRLKKKYPEEKP